MKVTKATKKQAEGAESTVVLRISGRAADLLRQWSSEVGERASVSWIAHKAIEAAAANQRFAQLLDSLNNLNGE